MCSILTLFSYTNFVCFWENLLTPPHSDAFHTLAIAPIPSPDSLFTFNLLLNKDCTNHLPDIRPLSKLVQEAGFLIWQDSVRDSSPDYPTAVSYTLLSNSLFNMHSLIRHYMIYSQLLTRPLNKSQKKTNKQKWNFRTPHNKERSYLFVSYYC